MVNTLQDIRISKQIKGFEMVQDELRLVEQRLLAEHPGHHNLLNNAAERLFRAGGKRIRASITLLAAGIFDADQDKTLSLAAGIEMLHTATLVHDDFIDGASLRRGKPTLNSGPNANFSILIGDYLFAKAANLVSETDNVEIMSQFARTLMTILNGEVTQQFARWSIDRQEYLDRIYAKTGAMFVLAAGAAATLGGADEFNRAALERYGYNTGIAFQIVDDVLDFTGKQTQLGKPVGNDLQQGLFTLPVLLYVERYPDDPDYLALLKTQDGNHPAASRLIESIRRSSVIDDALAEARDLAGEAQLALKDVSYSRYVDALSSIADMIINRKV